ncbi:IPTL-CTERM sorting domain-containing protein [Xylophilus sp. ASV27]|uniref:IPTL-CTERM sorting domain-containing protein n=1 Tax=Xylophilus sp. ASV27 TaxID=2795129 RepID=UPI001E33D305|nr:IPTL-CTERM sorting domain-containing protein [Xylophilus sp. ASV27]
MFDLEANKLIAITQFDVSPMGDTTIQIYYKAGTWVGFANSPNDWTLIQTKPVVYTGGFVPVALDAPFILPANQRYAFYITSNISTVNLNYSNGTGVGNVFSSDANLTFYEGGGLEYPFTQGTGAVYQPRVWNGAIHYAIVGPVTHYAVSAPSSAVQGAGVSLTVKALDANGYVNPDYAGTVHFSSSDGAAVLPADAGLGNGAGTFSATFRTLGSHTVTATDTVANGITGVSAVVVVAPAPSIPTLSEWALVGLSLVIAMFAMARMRRRHA